MIKLNQIPITVKIKYRTNEFDEKSGWPLIRIIYNKKIKKNFEASGSEIEFNITQSSKLKKSVLKIEHYGKNYHNDDKFFEIEKMWINNIDLEHIIWESRQYPILPPWDENSNTPFFYKGNLFLGHNGYIEWKFKNPILIDIKNRLGKTVSRIDGQETTSEVLNSIKNYFFTQREDSL